MHTLVFAVNFKFNIQVETYRVYAKKRSNVKCKNQQYRNALNKSDFSLKKKNTAISGSLNRIFWRITNTVRSWSVHIVEQRWKKNRVYTPWNTVEQCVHRGRYSFKLLEFFSILSRVAELKDIEKVNDQNNQHVVYTDFSSRTYQLREPE